MSPLITKHTPTGQTNARQHPFSGWFAASMQIVFIFLFPAATSPLHRLDVANIRLRGLGFTKASGFSEWQAQTITSSVQLAAGSAGRLARTCWWRAWLPRETRRGIHSVKWHGACWLIVWRLGVEDQTLRAGTPGIDVLDNSGWSVEALEMGLCFRC